MKGLERLKGLLSPMKGKMGSWTWFIRYAAVLVTFLFFFIPLQMRLSGVLLEKNALQKEIEDLKKITQSLLSPEEVKIVTARVEEFEGKLADVTKANEILGNVTRLAEEYHMKLVQIYPDSPLQAENENGQALEVAGRKVSILPVSFRVETGYKDLADFLKKLSDESRWAVTVESLELQRSSPESESLQCDVMLGYLVR